MRSSAAIPSAPSCCASARWSRITSRFPARTNVQLVRVESPGEATVAVWERGAGETLSSGTSAVAVAGAAVTNGWCESPIVVHLAGGDMRVDLDEGMNARLTGAAQEICTGEISAELLDDVAAR